MNRTIEYQYTPEIVQRAAQHFWFRWGRGMLVLGLVVFIMGFAGFCLGYLNCLTGAALVVPLLMLVAWKANIDTAVRTSRAMPDQTVRVTFSEDTVQFKNSLHESTFKWALVKTLWKFKTEWLFFTYTPGTYVFVLTSVLDSELQEFICTQLKEVNAKIV